MTDIKESYGEHADHIWDKYNSPYIIRSYLHTNQYQTIIKFLKEIDPTTVLDCGCGEGVLSILMAREGYKVSAVDISKPNIKVAKQKAKEMGVDVEFIIGDAENVPFADDSFDVVVSSHVLEHLPDMNKGLQEIKRLSDTAVIAVPTCLGLSSISVLGGASPWRLSMKTPLFFKGLAKLLDSLGKDGVMDTCYQGKEEFPHPWFFPKKFEEILEKSGLMSLKMEASTLCFPYVSYVFPPSIGLFKFLDKFKGDGILANFGYGTTYLTKRRAGK